MIFDLDSIVAPKYLKELRIETCNSCPDKKSAMNIEYCGICNCPLAGKVTLTQAKCPANKWPSPQ
jgi:hypothetical protein